jgi:outer membrane protein TolC
VAQTTALANQRTAVNLLGQRLVASAQLVANLGGGWTSSGLGERK